MGTRDTTGSYYMEDVGQADRLIAAKRSGNGSGISSSMGPGSGAYSSNYNDNKQSGSMQLGVNGLQMDSRYGGRPPMNGNIMNGRR